MAEQNAHTETSGGHKGGFPPFQKDTFASQLVWLAITFVLLYVVMSKIALPRVGAIIEERRKRIDSDLADANKLKGNAETSMAAYEKSLADARNRAQTIGAETRDKLHAEAEKNRKALDEQLNVKLAQAEKTIAETKSQAMVSVRSIATEAASAIVARLTGTAASESAVSQAVDSVLKR
ncbi:MAG TPA: F0F1 ATP synthase subunit B [Xanthobacteraceae bacterium]|nr:F0F1 ATP synthase subunit B [Xanthobacteraceae bacterium]